MIKHKSHKGLRKRIKLTGRGRLKYRRPYGSHLMRSKNAKRRRRIRKSNILTGPIAERMKIALGS